MGGTLHVVKGKDGEAAGYATPAVGMMTSRGEIVRVSERGYTTRGRSGVEYRYVKGTVGVPASVSVTEAKRWGWRNGS